MSLLPLSCCSASPQRQDNPIGPWRWSQEWRDVLFCHWQVQSEALQRHLPVSLEIDRWEGAAWVSTVSFRLANVRLRGLPAFGPVSNLLELNLRTYVRYRGEPGIYFLSMHADNRLAIALARWLTPLPYAAARIEYDGRVGPAAHRPRRPTTFTARVPSGGPALASSLVPPYEILPTSPPLFTTRFEPCGTCRESQQNSLDAWLLERYRAFVPDRRGRLCKMVVEHPPWQVQSATLEATAPRLGEPWELDLACSPNLWQFSSGLMARVWPFEILRP